MSTGAVRLPILDSAEAAAPTSKKRLPLLDQVLAAQRDMSAVERFAQLHEDVNSPLMEPYYRALLPASALIGGTYMVWVDTVARSATSAEMPLGVIAALIGAPLFAWLLRRTQGGGAHHA